MEKLLPSIVSPLPPGRAARLLNVFFFSLGKTRTQPSIFCRAVRDLLPDASQRRTTSHQLKVESDKWGDNWWSTTAGLHCESWRPTCRFFSLEKHIGLQKKSAVTVRLCRQSEQTVQEKSLIVVESTSQNASGQTLTTLSVFLWKTCTTEPTKDQTGQMKPYKCHQVQVTTLIFVTFTFIKLTFFNVTFSFLGHLVARSLALQAPLAAWNNVAVVAWLSGLELVTRSVVKHKKVCCVFALEDAGESSSKSVHRAASGQPLSLPLSPPIIFINCKYFLCFFFALSAFTPTNLCFPL